MMRKLLAAALLLAAGCAPSPAPAPAPRPRPHVLRANVEAEAESLGDNWVGGFEGEPFVRVDFASGVARYSPREEKGRAPLGIIHPKVTADAVRFAIDDGTQRREFQLRRLADDVLEGTAADKPVRFVRVLSSNDHATIGLAGTYAVRGNPKDLLFIDESEGGGALFDSRNGTERRLFPRAQRRALVGGGVGTAFPSIGDVTLDPTTGELRVGMGDPRRFCRGSRSDVRRFASTPRSVTERSCRAHFSFRRMDETGPTRSLSMCMGRVG